MAAKKWLQFGVMALAIGVSTSAFANEKATEIIDASVNGFIRLAYGALARSIGALDDRMVALCETPSQANLDAAREGFRSAADTFAYVELIRFGPITRENRLERLLFWPDRKSIGLKQVQAAIAEEDASAADAEKLAGKSVAMQGFGALEFVLFGNDSDRLVSAEGAYRCRYGEAIAINIAGMAGDLDAEWADPNGFARDWANPGDSNPVYRTGTEAVTELLEVFVNGLELVRDVRTNGFLGETAKSDKPKQAIYWRSQNTTRSLAMNMAGLKALFDASRLGENLPAESHWIAESMDFQLNEAINAAKAVDGPIDKALNDPAKRAKLEYYRVVTSGLSELFGTRLAGEFGLTAGFSSLDGD